jgi:hypothetical protein
VAERKLDVLVVRWYEHAGRSPDVVTRWLAAAREHLPEAVPRRYGDTEPLRGRFDRDGERGLAQAYAKADTLLFLAGTPPVFHGSLATGRGPSLGPVAVHSMQAELDPDDQRVRRFALALVHPGTVYVSASIAGGTVLDGRTLYGPAERPEEPYLAPLGAWLGLPPAPPAWCWFGPGYARLVKGHVNAEAAAGGLVFTGGPWVSEPLRARLHEVDPVRRTAARLPRGLRRSPLRFW